MNRLSVRDRLRHILNPLHVYCSLSWMIHKKRALKAARSYERRIYNPIFRNFFL